MQSYRSTEPRRLPSQQRGERRVAELVEAAEAVIADSGYEAATMSAIADRAGASIGSLYQFFPNKAAITQALRTEYAKQFESLCAPLAEEACGLSLKVLSTRLIDLTIRFVDTHPAFLSLLDAPRSTRSLPAIHNLILERLAAILQARQPRIAKPRAMRLATVTLQIMKALNQLYTELQDDQRRPLVEEFKLVLYSYLRASIPPHGGAPRNNQRGSTPRNNGRGGAPRSNQRGRAPRSKTGGGPPATDPRGTPGSNQ